MAKSVKQETKEVESVCENCQWWKPTVDSIPGWGNCELVNHFPILESGVMITGHCGVMSTHEDHNCNKFKKV